mmetsp:Transcript_11313/g.34971  ORF Transcript_11313/g.34971 Transcript_11313/m.34971 type:complete len:940 (+) Transcript_11313:1-2820(+)
MTLNFSLDKVKFAKLLQLSMSYEDLVARWFEDFSCDRASQVVDGLEFLSAAILISSKVSLFRKVGLLFGLFDLDRTGCIRKDEFTIFLKAATTGLHRAVSGLPPPASVVELGGLSAEFFGTVQSQALSQELFLSWVTEAHYSLHYLSVLSRLGTAVFAWGSNQRRQLGLSFAPQQQRVPAPLLTLEGLRVAHVASGESHSLFLTEEGRVWTCGSGFCGILGHGSLEDCPQPRLLESLAHTQVLHVAVGVRHSVAVSEKGQVFTWGSADMGQLGHGSTEDREVHEWAFDPKSGGSFSYVPRPTVVMGLFGRRICARKASCCNFSTAVLTDQGHLYTWGNNTDGQCGQGQKCPDHRLIYVDPHMQRTAMQAILSPRRLEAGTTFRTLACGGYHMLAVDQDSRVWSWGQGMWGKLGHGDQRSMYEPKLVHALRYHVCLDVAAGEAHSLCLCSLHRLTVTGSDPERPLSPFSLLGLPAGRVDRDAAARRPATPPNSKLQFNAFACARLLRVGLPFLHDPELPVPNPDGHAFEDAILLADRGLWEGQWLKLSSTDFDFRVSMSPSGAQLSARAGLPGPLLYASEGKWEAATDCRQRVCVFEELLHSTGTSPEELTPAILELARRCQEGQGLACLCILPKKAELFTVQAPPDRTWTCLRSLAFGVMSYEHGMALKKHVARLVNDRLNGVPGELPEEVRDWRECREDFTGRAYFENTASGAKRRAPPQVDPGVQAWLLDVREDGLLPRLRALLELRPRGVILCQQSWRPDVELLSLPEALLEELVVPVVTVTYEAGEELKAVAAKGAQPWISMELQPFGALCAWGNGTFGQLGLSAIENRHFLTRTQNALTNEETSFADRPCYVAHLHEHQVLNVACGAAHSVAVTQQGEVFTWGAADGLGVPLEKSSSGVPMFVEQLEGLVKCTRAFAGHYHSFVLAEMPFSPAV